jgi:hypothetical protein
MSVSPRTFPAVLEIYGLKSLVSGPVGLLSMVTVFVALLLPLAEPGADVEPQAVMPASEIAQIAAILILCFT